MYVSRKTLRNCIGRWLQRTTTTFTCCAPPACEHCWKAPAPTKESRKDLIRQVKMVRTLEGQINSLGSIVPVGIVRNLHSFRFLGNKALHRLAEPTRDDLGLALRVIEDLLNVIYDLDYRAQRLYEKATKDTGAPKQ